ncbi:hypothetical protein ACHAW5_002459 [Stephanodiscus triporus]|uniref:Uncharacterized protein n=1 Tax=Stephanodiscus triporus TaxID=2934178 RepID=A0ABD3Q599_9STRA
MEDVHGACRSFAKSVDDYIDRIILRGRRRRKRLRDVDDYDDDYDHDASTSSSLRRECNELVRHANLVLRTLVAKRSSLENAISALRAESKDYVERFAAAAPAAASSSSSPSLSVDDDVEKRGKNGVVDDVVAALGRTQVEIVRRWFANYVRLRDGFVLLESGERRHDHDDDGDVSFPSRLGGAYCSDGYTRRFKSERGYTGRGYDEAYDPDVGIKRRLLVALSRFDGSGRTTPGDIDEKLFENETTGAYMWEKRMDEVNETSALRDELRSVAEYFRNGINAVSRVKLNMKIDDKFDRFDLGGSLVLSRQGDDYKVKDRGGSLPIGMSVDDWREKFSLSRGWILRTR